MSGRRGTVLPVVSFAVVSVAVAWAGHVLGHGHGLDSASALLAVALAGGLGVVLVGRWTPARLVAALAAVQGVVHVLGSAGIDPRLVAPSAHAHGYEALSSMPSGGSSTSMLVWHAVAVPVAALALEAVRRSVVVVSWLTRPVVLFTRVMLPAPAAAPVPDGRPRAALPRPHLLVSRSNAPPCPA